MYDLHIVPEPISFQIRGFIQEVSALLRENFGISNAAKGEKSCTFIFETERHPAGAMEIQLFHLSHLFQIITVQTGLKKVCSARASLIRLFLGVASIPEMQQT